MGIGEIVMENANRSDIENIRVMKKESPEISLYMLLCQANDIMLNAVELELKQYGITIPQVRVMVMLSRENRPVTLDELVKWNLREFNSVSTLINRMEKKGLVRKFKKDGDRKTYIELTDEGNILYHQKVTERSIQLIMGALSNEEKNQLGSLLRKVRDTARDTLGLDFRPPFLP
jgi:MarR family transcriptional regulator, negative regulator of the multidrug operon emrRAB